MKIVRSFTATEQELEMLEAVAQYHGFTFAEEEEVFRYPLVDGFSKSSTITNLLKKEFWRIFPGGTDAVQPQPGARISGQNLARDGER